MWAYSGMAPYIGPHLRLTSQSSDERPWRAVPTWQGPSGREEKQQAILAFFFKAFRRHSFCVILPPPKTTSTRFWICHSVRSQQSRSRTPFWRPRSTRSTRSTLAPLPILREALPGRVGRWSCADGLARVPWTPFVAERKRKATSPSFGSAELRSSSRTRTASKTSKGNQPAHLT